MLKLNLFLKFSQKDSIVFSMQNHIAAIVIAKLKKYKMSTMSLTKSQK